MDATNTKYRIRQCSKCPEDLEYFCVTCSSDLCLQCGENHMMMNLNKDTCNVIIYREKSNYLQKHEICLRHPNNVYTKYCELCKIPICTDCTDHRNHRQTDIGTAYEAKRENKEIVENFQGQALPIRFALLADIKLDLKTFISDVADRNSKILRSSEKLKGCIDNVLHELHLTNLCLKQKIEMNKYIASICIYEHKYEQSSDAPIQFLLSVKKHKLKTFKNYGHITLTTCKFSKTEMVFEKLLSINSTIKGYHRMDRLLTKMMSALHTMMPFLKYSKRLYSLSRTDFKREFGHS